MALSRGQLTRQKMINLMYLVFIAMLALNVPTEVLDGFDLVNENLQESIKVADERNKQIYTDINASYEGNPEKTQDSYSRALNVKSKTDSLFDYIQYLKLEIAKESDGKEADLNNLKSKDNLSASTDIMIAPEGGHQGENLKKLLDSYREAMIAQIPDEMKKSIVRNTLSTEPSRKAKKEGKSWVLSSFENMPSIAAITYLTELQVNIRHAEGEVLNDLVKNIDLKDVRVNQLSAFVVPQSKFVMQGTPYRAEIILAAVDTTQRPRIVINGKELPYEKNGLFETTGIRGPNKFSGFIEVMGRDGTPFKREFSDEFTVMEPMATIAPLLMDVVYAGYQNPISISVPGVPNQDVVATVVSGGSLTVSGNNWTATPSTSQIGQKFVISVSARMNGTMRPIAQKEFRIRALPDPAPYIEYRDASNNPKVFKRGNLARSILLGTSNLKAAIDDGILNIPFTVTGFSTISLDAMNNRSEEISAGSNFTERQKEQMRGLTRGKELIIGKIKVRGPDGIERELNAMIIRII